MRKKLPTTAIGRARDRRGLTQRRLADLSGYSDKTVRTTEAEPRTVAKETVAAVLIALAARAPFTDTELSDLAQQTALDFHAIESMSDAAGRTPPDDGAADDRIRGTLAHLSDQLGDDTAAVAAMLDAINRVCLAAVSRAQREIANDEHLTDFVRSMTHRVLVELHPSLDATDDGVSVSYTAKLPAAIDGNPVAYTDEHGHPIPLSDRPDPIRVIIPPVREGGAMIERFEYYTPDGRRLVPEPPKAKPLRGDRHA